MTYTDDFLTFDKYPYRLFLAKTLLEALPQTLPPVLPDALLEALLETLLAFGPCLRHRLRQVGSAISALRQPKDGKAVLRHTA